MWFLICTAIFMFVLGLPGIVVYLWHRRGMREQVVTRHEHIVHDGDLNLSDWFSTYFPSRSGREEE